MKKKLLSFILAFLLCVSLIPAALADSDKSIVYDREGPFDEYDTEIISGKLAELNRIYGVDVAVVTASSLDGKTAEEYADDFYDENGIGQGASKRRHTVSYKRKRARLGNKHLRKLHRRFHGQ